MTNLYILSLGWGTKLSDCDQDAGDEPDAADQQPRGDSAPALADTCLPALQACWHSNAHHEMVFPGMIREFLLTYVYISNEESIMEIRYR